MTASPAHARSGLLDQPRAVWAVAFACVVAFMGIGLVDPILTSIAADLDAGPSNVSLLFTSYFAVTGVSMLVTFARGASARGGADGLEPWSLCALAAPEPIDEMSSGGLGPGQRPVHRQGALVIIGSASGGDAGAVILYEAALGSASRAARSSAACSATSPGAGRSSAPPSSWRSASSRSPCCSAQSARCGASG